MILHSAEAAVQKAGNPYTVKEGDTLFDIAQAYYNDGNQWQKIAQDPANKGKIENGRRTRPRECPCQLRDPRIQCLPEKLTSH